MSTHHHPHHGEPGTSRLNYLRNRVVHILRHDHDHTHSKGGSLDTGAIGIRATKISLLGLGATAAAQAVIVVFSGSVALLSDTVHNLSDALTAIPLWLAFSLSRRHPTRTYTYGLHRAEDIAGLVIVAAIGASAVLIIWESATRLIEPRLIDHIPWVIAAGFIGALGNELVARYRMRIGHTIGSEALIADGQHARTDAFTSLAVVAAGIGAAFDVAWIDPVAGFVVAGGVVWLLARSARRIGRRLLDGVEPEVVDTAAAAIREVDGVYEITDLRVRWHGHRLHVVAAVSVDPDIPVHAGHTTAHDVEHALHHAFSFPVDAVIHIDPHGLTDTHQSTAHHTRSPEAGLHPPE